MLPPSLKALGVRRHSLPPNTRKEDADQPQRGPVVRDRLSSPGKVAYALQNLTHCQGRSLSLLPHVRYLLPTNGCRDLPTRYLNERDAPDNSAKQSTVHGSTRKPCPSLSPHSEGFAF
jgi:hypothetical protein